MTPSRLPQNKYADRALALIFLLTVTLTMSAQWTVQQTAQEEEGGIPAYNAGPPPKGTKLPPMLTKDQLWGADAQYPYQAHAYELLSRKATPRVYMLYWLAQLAKLVGRGRTYHVAFSESLPLIPKFC